MQQMVYNLIYKKFEFGVSEEIIVKNIIPEQRFKSGLLLRFIIWCLSERIYTKCSSEI